jgi:hypothetical protein
MSHTQANKQRGYGLLLFPKHPSLLLPTQIPSPSFTETSLLMNPDSSTKLFHLEDCRVSDSHHAPLKFTLHKAVNYALKTQTLVFIYLFIYYQ